MVDECSKFIKRFRALTAIDLSCYSRSQVLRRLTAFQQKHGLDSLQQLSLALESSDDLLEECLGLLTITVSEFFRDREQWQLLKDKISDLAIRRLPLRFWSAGCASGEEPYSLAFMLGSMLPRRCWAVLASDLSSKAISAAVEGIYPAKALNKLTPAEKTAMFNPVDVDKFQVKEALRQRVAFFHHNLLSEPYPASLDVVLCRNVIIYFNEGARNRVLGRIAQSLNPGGMLLVGGSEQIIAPQKLGLEREDVYIYKKADSK